MSFVEKYAEMHQVTPKEARTLINNVVDTIEELLKEEGRAQIHNFGTFKIQERSARNGHNPATGEMMRIPAKKVVKFAAASVLKDKMK